MNFLLISILSPKGIIVTTAMLTIIMGYFKPYICPAIFSVLFLRLNSDIKSCGVKVHLAPGVEGETYYKRLKGRGSRGRLRGPARLTPAPLLAS